MCIIAIKPKTKPIQDKKILQQCFSSNRDGAGYMFVNNDRKVEIKKGYMTFDEFYKALMEDYETYNLKNKTVVMHFRIGTSGKSKQGCTHPFPITNDMTKLEETKLTTNIGICHNGIISGFNSHINQYSDTQLYIAAVLTPIIKLNLTAYKFKDVQTLILKTTTSKWTILDINDEYYTIGDFIEDNGYLYSNSTFRQLFTLPTNNKNKPNNSAEYDDDDDEYDAGWYRDYFKLKDKQDKLKENKPALQHGPVDETLYREIEKGNILVAEGTTPYYKSMFEFLEVERDGEYYFTKDYDVYRLFTGANACFIRVGKKANIYTDYNLIQRRDFIDA